MGITKDQLKMIVKECLVEILSEGIGPSIDKNIYESKRHQQVKNLAPQKAKQAAPTPTAALKETIKREAGGNPVMADIFADTAATTLQTMIESDRSKAALQPTGKVERIVAAASPEQIFGEEAASKWASLAFMDPIKK
jgi:hypothetical protein